MAGIKDFYRGDTLRYKLTFKDADTQTPVDLTGASIWFTLKSNISEPDNEAAIQVHTETHIDAVNGKTEIVVPASETNNLDISTYFYDFQLVDAQGNVSTVMSGKVKVLPDVTRSI